MTDGLRGRLGDAARRTANEKTARLWVAWVDLDGDAPPEPSVEWVGVVDFVSERALLESRPSDEMFDFLAGSANELADRAPAVFARAPERDEAGQEHLFIGDLAYMRARFSPQWVGHRTGWWERPLLPLSMLAAVSRDIEIGENVEVRGYNTTEYRSAVDASAMAALDPSLPMRELFGRHQTDTIALRAWLDDAGRAIRISWAMLPIAADDSTPWSTTEFWDFGIEVSLAAPPEELTSPPATAREIVRDLRQMRKLTKG
jgi:hypothetical protein